jgi:hypothetical protein
MLNINISSKKWEYDINLVRRITVLFDESGTGKSTLYRLIQSFTRRPQVLNCRYRCLPLVFNEDRLDLLHSSLSTVEQVIFIDEDETVLESATMLDLLAHSKSHLVIICRSLHGLVYGLNNVYKISSIKGYHYLEPYFKFNINEFRKPHIVIVEDSNSAFEFYSILFNRKGIKTISSNGKYGLRSSIKKYSDNFNILVVFDGCGIGSAALDGYHAFTNPRVQCFAEESFEWILLISDMFYSHIKADDLWILDPSSEQALLIYNYERFLFDELVKLTQSSSKCVYSKSNLKDCYKSACCCHNSNCGFYKEGCDKIKMLLGQFYNKFPFLDS